MALPLVALVLDSGVVAYASPDFARWDHPGDPVSFEVDGCQHVAIAAVQAIFAFALQ